MFCRHDPARMSKNAMNGAAGLSIPNEAVRRYRTRFGLDVTSL
jgi:hypothetical protein